MKTISSIEQARNAKPDVYGVKGATGVTFRKTNDVVGAGTCNLRFRLGKERLTMSLGLLSEFNSITEIREAADAKRALARKGINPIEERKRAKAANLAAERARQGSDCL